MADGLEVVSPRLLDALVGVDRRVPGRARQVLPILVRNVLTFAVFETFSEPEVNDVDLIFRLVSSTDEEVVRLNISVDNSLLVHFLDAHQLNHYSEPQV
jgi:hypothetical protein